ACLVEGAFGGAGGAVVIEEFLRGEECSWMVVTDGTAHVALPPARDFKRAEDGDTGSNTGGMGAYAPAPIPPSIAEAIGERIVTPVLRTMMRRGTPFRGLLYCGLMITDEGPRVLEFNARFGDPETQVVLPLVGGSLRDLLHGAATSALDERAVEFETSATVAV